MSVVAPEDISLLGESDAEHPGGAVLDLVGVGFGPSNLGLAIAIEEHNENESYPLSAEFVETKPEFGWHTGMLLPRTTMQISFLKDLATQRNVNSRFTFINYLAERGRLTDFINQQTFFPTRLEFHDYLSWAAAGVSAKVRYSTRAVAVRTADGCLEVDVVGPSGRQTLRARNVVLAGGLTPRLPEGVTLSERQFHNHRLLDHIEMLPEMTHKRIVVVGAGQSAAEVAEYLHSRFGDTEIHGVFAKYGFTPADDSPYANRIFDPTAVDEFYTAAVEVRRQLMDYHKSTNYSCVDLSLIEELYRREYAERVSGRRRLFFRGASSLQNVVEDDSGLHVEVMHHPTESVEQFDCDAVIYATGFDSMSLPDILGNLYDADTFKAGPRLTRDYRLETTSALPGNIYLQGGTEHTHGLTSSLLSNIAIRAGEILASVTGSPLAAAPVRQ